MIQHLEVKRNLEMKTDMARRLNSKLSDPCRNASFISSSDLAVDMRWGGEGVLGGRNDQKIKTNTFKMLQLLLFIIMITYLSGLNLNS